MVEHNTLGGSNCHDPKGKLGTLTPSGTGVALTLNASLTPAYRIYDSDGSTTAFGITTATPEVYTDYNLLTVNADQVRQASAVSSTIQMLSCSASSVSRSKLGLVLGTGGLVTANVTQDTGSGYANVSTILHLGTSGMSGVNSLAGSVVFNGTTNAGAAISASLAIAYNSTDARANLTLGTVHQLIIDNGSNSFIIGGGNHTTSISTNSVVIGASSTAQNTSGARSSNTVVGYNSSADNQSNSTCIGQQVTAGGGKCTLVGSAANGSSTNGEITLVGYSSSSTADYTTCIGASSGITSSSAAASIAIGYSAQVNVSHTCLIGGDSTNGYIDLFVIGRGLTTATASTLTIRTPNASGATTNGWSMIIQAGRATNAAGAGVNGTIQFQTGDGTGGSSTLSAATERMTITAGATGHIKIPANTSFLEIAESSAAPTAITGSVLLYAKDVGGTTKLFVRDEAGTETQLGT